MSNLRTVQDIYAAFGRGDIPAILNQLADDVDWEYGTMDAGVPWLKPRKGHAEVLQFFEALGALEFTKFEPHTLLEKDGVVVALIGLGIVVKANGRTIEEEDEVHIWRFNAAGKVARFCHRMDTHKHWLALRGE